MADGLHQAVRSGTLVEVEACLAAGADVNEKDAAAQTPLYFACFDNVDLEDTRGVDLEIIRALVAHHADPNIANVGGATPFMIACRWRSVEEIKVCCKSG